MAAQLDTAALAAGVALGLGIAACGAASTARGDGTLSGRGKSENLLPKTLNDALEGRIAAAQDQLKALTREAGDADEAPARLPAPYAVRMSTRRELTPAEREAYDRDGFVRTPIRCLLATYPTALIRTSLQRVSSRARGHRAH